MSQEQIEKAVEQLIDQIDGMMLRLRNGYLERSKT